MTFGTFIISLAIGVLRPQTAVDADTPKRTSGIGTSSSNTCATPAGGTGEAGGIEVQHQHRGNQLLVDLLQMFRQQITVLTSHMLVIQLTYQILSKIEY